MTNDPLDPSLLDQIKTILRRDLKLGPDADIPDDMAFFGGDIDLDSLDMLLLVTSIEKQFGIKVPNEAVGKEVFQSVQSLTEYVRQQQSASPSATPTAIPAEGDWLAKLPHGPAFLFISEVISVTPGQSASAVWRLTGDEPFFAGHFPGNPVVPGVLIAEALAQTAGLSGPVDAPSAGKLAHVDVRFEQAVRPPCTIELQATLNRMMGDLQLCDVVATVDANPVARGTIALHRA